MELERRNALITGANRGLGKALASHFVRAGANVFLVARDQELLAQVQKELAAQVVCPGQRVCSRPVDVSKAEQCSQAVAEACSSLGSLTVLVNNAGVYGPMGRIEDVNWQEWVQAMEINLYGALFMCRACIPHFRGQNYGKIINISGGGATAPLPGISAYAASKVALVRLTETMAHELKDARVDVNAIAPGALNTRLLDQVLAAGPDKVGADFYRKSLKQREEGGTSLEKAGRLAVFLASAASDGISGRLLSAVWDDWEHLPAWAEKLRTSDMFTLRRVVPSEQGK